MIIEGPGSVPLTRGSGSGSMPLTSGSGYGRPKNMWIWWIRFRNTAGMTSIWSTSSVKKILYRKKAALIAIVLNLLNPDPFRSGPHPGHVDPDPYQCQPNSLFSRQFYNSGQNIENYDIYDANEKDKTMKIGAAVNYSYFFSNICKTRRGLVPGKDLD
jgi:hypothetical protein